jgi:hypothetical protein
MAGIRSPGGPVASPSGRSRSAGVPEPRAGVAAGSTGNSKRFVRRARRDRSAAQATEARDGESAPGRTEIRSDSCGGPGGIAPPLRPRKLETGSQPRVGRKFERPARNLERSRRAGPGSSGRGETAPGRTGIRSDSCGRPGEIAPPRRPRKLGTGSQLWVGREFKAIGAAGPEKSLRRAGPEARDGGVSLGSDENSRRICGGPGGIAPPRRTGNPGRDESALRRTGIRNGGCGEHAKKIAPAVLRPRCDRVRVQFGCS